jgi:hypothetical protein
MTYTTYSVSRHNDEGFTLRLEEHSIFRDVTSHVIDSLLCEPFGHRFYWQFWLCNKLDRWAWRGEKEIAVFPITREQAHEILGNDSLMFFDEDNR